MPESRTVDHAWSHRVRSALRLNLPIYLLYLALVLLITWPLVTVLGTDFAGYPFGDAHEMARHIWWFKSALQTRQPVFFQPLLAYPDGLQGVILWSNPLQFFPAWLFAFVLPLPAAYNLTVLLTLALNGWAAYWLVWRLTAHRPSALLAGVVFLAAPTMQGHLAGGHGGLMVQWPLPLLAYSLFQLRSLSSPLLKGESARALLLTAVFFVLTPLGHTLQLIYAVLPLVGLFGLTLLVRQEWRALLRLLVAVGMGVVVLLVFLLPVANATLGTTAYADEGGAVDFSLDLLALVTPSFNHPVYGSWEYTHRVLGTNIVEGSAYIGIIAGLLSLLAVWRVRAARWWLLLAAVTWVLALGPLLKILNVPVNITVDNYFSYVPLPWVALADLPVLNLARTPGRFSFLIALTLAVLVGYGFNDFCRRGFKIFGYSTDKGAEGDQGELQTTPSVGFSSRRLAWLSRSFEPVALVIMLLLVLDYQSFWPLPTYSAAIPQAVYDLARRDDVRAVFDIPWDNVLAAKDALWLQTAHHKPLIAGHVTRRTPVSPAKLTMLQTTLDPGLLNEAGADVVILHKHYDNSDSRLRLAIAVVLGEPWYEDERIALFDVPQSGQTTQTSVQQTQPERIDWYLYAAEPGWVWLESWGSGLEREGRAVVVQLDGEPLYVWLTSAATAPDLWIPIPEAGYHTLSAIPQPACPSSYSPALRCQTFGETETGGMGAHALRPGTFTEIRFASGLRLGGAYLPEPTDDRLPIGLWWQFDQPRTVSDVRFVKVLDGEGNQVAGVDATLGDHASGSQWADTVTLDLPDDLPPGTYRVYAGWYTYPDLSRFPVLSDVPGAADGLAFLGEFALP